MPRRQVSEIALRCIKEIEEGEAQLIPDEEAMARVRKSIGQ
jgi:hypothetical protein